MSTAPAKVERLELRMAAVPGAVRAIRRAVRRFAVDHGVEDVDGVALAVSEAATNAVLHAYRDGRGGDVRVVACAEPDRLVVVVRDYGCGMRPRPDSPGLGVGLSAIGHLATTFNVEAPDGDGTRLRMHFPRA
jgi:serine/threonine-protein kinase RsbW/stage II sporulation protein AB (anti-sigma F factor)